MDGSASSFARATARYSAAQHLFETSTGGEARVLVALSGGPDSCALLLALTEAAENGLPLPRPVAVAHFHHGLRGTDADEDAAFSERLAERLGTPCRTGRGTVPKGTGRSPNDAARRARHEFLIESALRYGATHLATAHTADDQAETVLGRVLRGVSIDGLAGIPPRRRLASGLLLVRPLLDQRRAEVEAYCAARGITPRRDPSNEQDRYTRARLRKHLPGLAAAFNPQLVEALNRLSAHAAADRDYLSDQAGSLWERSVEIPTRGVARLSVVQLRGEHPALRRRVLLRAIREVAETVGAEEAAAVTVWVDALEALLLAVGEEGRPVTLPGNLRAERIGEILAVTAPSDEPPVVAPPLEPVPLPIPGTIALPWADLQLSVCRIAHGDAPAPRVPRARVIDIAVSEGTPLAVRPAREGERMAPFGMKGRTRLLRDLLAEAAVPAARRAWYPVVTRADTGAILWLIGVAQGESTRVADGSPYLLRLSAPFVARTDLLPATQKGTQREHGE
ncbi:MAG: tRNA lysidine(34) synthetase TilS [Cytophagales bacterium]|nr:tRNA lysidine(34) synthetase TilS [Armatimonadota bacterium]